MRQCSEGNLKRGVSHVYKPDAIRPEVEVEVVLQGGEILGLVAAPRHGADNFEPVIPGEYILPINVVILYLYSTGALK